MENARVTLLMQILRGASITFVLVALGALFLRVSVVAPDARPLVSQTGSLATSLNKTVDSVNKLLNGSKPDGSDGLANKLQAVADGLQKTAATLQTSADSLQRTTAVIQAQVDPERLKKIMSDAQTTSDNVRATTANLVGVTHNVETLTAGLNTEVLPQISATAKSLPGLVATYQAVPADVKVAVGPMFDCGKRGPGSAGAGCLQSEILGTLGATRAFMGKNVDTAKAIDGIANDFHTVTNHYAIAWTAKPTKKQQIFDGIKFAITGANLAARTGLLP